MNFMPILADHTIEYDNIFCNYYELGHFRYVTVFEMKKGNYESRTK